MADKLKNLLALKFKSYQAAVTSLDEEVKNTTPDAGSIQDALEVAETKLNSFFESQTALINVYAEDADEDKFLEEEKRQGKLQREMKKMKRDVAEFLFLNNPQDDPIQTTADSKKHNLPKMKLPVFSGDVREWLGFWAIFQTVDEHAGYTDAEKFSYLLQCLKEGSDARKLVSSFPVCAKNYPAAVDTLKQHYGREKMLVKVYVLDLLQLVIKNSTQKNKITVMDIVPQLSSQIRNLSELGVTSDKCEEILYPVVEACLPDEVLQAWQRNPYYDESLDPLMTFLNSEVINQMDRSLAKVAFGDSSTGTSISGKKNKDSLPDTPAAAALMVVQSSGKSNSKAKGKCIFCEKGHESHDCGKAKTQMTVEQRLAIVKQKKLCYQCLKGGHITRTCKAFVRCSFCGGRHYEMLCTGNKSSNSDKNDGPAVAAAASHNMMIADQNPQKQTFSNMQYGYQVPVQQSTFYPSTQRPSSNGRASSTLWTPDKQSSPPDVKTGMSNIGGGNRRSTLHTLLVKVKMPQKDVIVRAFIDDGSDESYITNQLAQFGACRPVGSKTFTHQLFGGNITKPAEHRRFLLTLENIDGGGSVNAYCYGVDRIAHRISKPQPGVWMEQLYRLGVPYHDQTDAPEDIQILIGMDVASQIWTGGFVRLSQYFIAKETTLGWVVGGTQQSSEPVDDSGSHMVTTMMIKDMNPEDLWSLEVLGIREEPASQTKKEIEAATLQHFKKTVKRLEDGRYEVEFPWIEGHKEIKNNKSQAIAQLHKVTKDLKDQNYLSAYDAIFKQWRDEGIIEEVTDQSIEDNGYYMPHRHVVKESSTTTPLRPVFNASARAKDSVSLNDCLVKGPNMLELIPSIMTKFRRYQYGVIADVKKAFLQMSIAPKDRDYVRFLWWENGTCKKIRVYRHKRVVFGVRPSPFLLAATMTHHLEQEGKNHPHITRKLLDSLYVDNSVTSHPTMKEAIDFQHVSQQLLLPAHFDLRGWEFGPCQDSKVVAVLGMNWHTKEDVLSLCLDNMKKRLSGKSTRRGLLSIVNSIFDPMGFVCPFTLIPKLLFQQCCILKLSWDEALPEDISNQLEKWKSQVSELDQLLIPRWMTNTNEDSRLSIHTFSDGSAVAYSAAVFLRSEHDGNVQVQLAMAKSRVVPVDRKMTIPRIELTGCLIAARLTQVVKSSLGVDGVPEHYWTDSTAALAWIQHDKPWGRFVQARVDEIRQLTNQGDWRHVPGEMNPADLPSRGCSASQLLEMRWWEGPLWLRSSSDNWPVSKATAKDDIVEGEMKKSVVSSMNTEQEDNYVLSQLVKHSDFNKSLLVVAAMRRWITRVRDRLQQSHGAVNKVQKGEIPVATAEEIEDAERCILKLVQECSFTGADDKRLRGMSAFADRNGIIRIKSQLLFGHDDFNVRCPIVLPNDHEMVKLLMRKEHEHNSHAGLQNLQAILRERYWILSSRRAISSIIKTCVACRRFVARKCEVPSAQLPHDRIRDTYSFNITGVDLAGPLFLRGGDRVWIVLFTDAVYRGVHLELVNTLSTEGFIASFRRFIARRGRPSIVYSDNGLNFIGCRNLFTHVDWSQVTRYAAVEKISWKLNPPTAAWWGGWWERMVGLVKTLLRRILGKQVVNLDQLHTIICDVEATINRRPLTFLSDKDGELQPLCPVNFMRDNPSEALPEADAVDSYALRKGVRACQVLREKLRTRFRKEYLAQLQHFAGNRNVTVKAGDVVLIEVDDKKRIDWPWGVIQEVYPGRDGKMRTALVKTKTGNFLRPVQRLYILEASSASPGTASPEKAPEEELPATENEEVEQVNGNHVPVVPVTTKFGRKIIKPNRLGILK